HEVIDKGKETFEKKIAEPPGENVREKQPLKENPIAPDPSRDPDKFVAQATEQITGISKEASKDLKLKPDNIVKEPLNMFGNLVEHTFGTVFEMARDQFREETIRDRLEDHKVIGMGFAAELDSKYPEQSNWKLENSFHQELCDQAKNTVQGLSNKLKAE